MAGRKRVGKNASTGGAFVFSFYRGAEGTERFFFCASIQIDELDCRAALAMTTRLLSGLFRFARNDGSCSHLRHCEECSDVAVQKCGCSGHYWIGVSLDCRASLAMTNHAPTSVTARSAATWQSRYWICGISLDCRATLAMTDFLLPGSESPCGRLPAALRSQ